MVQDSKKWDLRSDIPDCRRLAIEWITRPSWTSQKRWVALKKSGLPLRNDRIKQIQRFAQKNSKWRQ
jgi:hypothetical protein